MKWIHNKDEVPKEPHYAIIEFSSYYVEGDERSRTNPGHGYPGHSENKAEYIVFDSKEEWEGEVQKRMYSKFTGSGQNFVAVKVIPASVQTQIHVKVDEGRFI